MFLLFHGNFSMFLHTVSIWHTLVLAIWRLIMIKSHTKAVTYCTMHRCYVLLVLGYGQWTCFHSIFPHKPEYFSCPVGLEHPQLPGRVCEGDHQHQQQWDQPDSVLDHSKDNFLSHDYHLCPVESTCCVK